MARRKYTKEIAEWVCGLEFGDIPERIVEECKSQAMSVLAAMFAGSRTPAGMAAAGVLGKSCGADVTKIPGGGKASLNDALLVNSALSMVLDYDDYLFAGHTGHSAVLVPLAMSEVMDVSGEQFITAQTIANEVEARIGASVTIGPLNGQMWAFIHAAGAAAATSKLLGLDADQTASAIGLALSQPNYPTVAGFFNSDAKLLTASWPIVQGVSAAKLAAAGLKGPDDILENKSGFCAAFSHTPLFAALTGLGKVWLSDTLSYKIYPGCAYLDAPLDCVFELTKGNIIPPQDVIRIDVHASLLSQKMDEMSLPYIKHALTNPVALGFYMPYNIAAAIIDGALGPAQLVPERIADDAIWSLARKVRVKHDVKYTAAVVDNVTNLIDMRKVLGSLNVGAVREMVSQMGFASPFVVLSKGRDMGELIKEGAKAIRKFAESGADEVEEAMLAAGAEGFRMAFGARVTIEMKGGSTLEFEQEVPRGAAGWNLEEKRRAVMAKFEKEASAVLPDEKANHAFGLLLQLEALDASALGQLPAACSA